jgi:AraC family transcriptional regulator
LLTNGSNVASKELPELQGITLGVVDEHWTINRTEVLHCLHQADLVLPNHSHDRPTLQLVLTGASREKTGRRELDLMPGTVLFRPPGAHHANVVGPTGLESLILALPFGRENLPGAAVTACSPVFLNEARSIELELSKRLPGWSALVEGSILTVLGRLQRCEEREDRGPWLQQAAELALQGFSLCEIAASLGRGPSMVAKSFRRHFGVSVGAFCRRERLLRAEREIRQGRPLADVALNAGFYDQSHFTRVFREQFGTTPAQYRREMGVLTDVAS